MSKGINSAASLGFVTSGAKKKKERKRMLTLCLQPTFSLK